MIYKISTIVKIYSDDGKKIDEYKLDRYFDEEMLKALNVEDK